jgi:hypothetical protein
MSTTAPNRGKRKSADPEAVAADQEELAAARERVAANGVAPAAALQADIDEAADDDEVPMSEDATGQLSIAGPGTERTFSTDAGGPPPEKGILKVKGITEEWGADLPHLHDMLILAHVRIEGVSITHQKVFNGEVVGFVEYEVAGMGPREALVAVHDLKDRGMYDRAAIDQCAAAAQDILENGAPESGVDLAAEIRERMYERFHIDDDAREATVGTVDHAEAFTDLDQPATDVEQPQYESPAVSDEEMAAAKERDLERRIGEARDAGNTAAEEALRDELAEHRVASDHDLAWNESEES